MIKTIIEYVKFYIKWQMTLVVTATYAEHKLHDYWTLTDTNNLFDIL